MKMRVYAIFYQDVEVGRERPYGKHLLEAKKTAMKRPRKWVFFHIPQVAQVVKSR